MADTKSIILFKIVKTTEKFTPFFKNKSPIYKKVQFFKATFPSWRPCVRSACLDYRIRGGGEPHKFFIFDKHPRPHTSTHKHYLEHRHITDHPPHTHTLWHTQLLQLHFHNTHSLNRQGSRESHIQHHLWYAAHNSIKTELLKIELHQNRIASKQNCTKAGLHKTELHQNRIA